MFNFTEAIIRRPGDDFNSALSMDTKDAKDEVDISLLKQQHQAYEKVLLGAGLKLKVAPPLLGFPDASFVEDTHLILPEVVFFLTSGAKSRRGEGISLRSLLPSDRPHIGISTPMDGGDILVVEKKIFVGLSTRSKQESVDFLRENTKDFSYEVIAVKLPSGLHLKSSVTALDCETFIVTPEIFSLGIFQQYGKKLILVQEGETLGANILPINNCVLIPPRHPKLKKDLEALPKVKEGALRIIEVDTSEFNKKDGALSCLSLRYS